MRRRAALLLLLTLFSTAYCAEPYLTNYALLKRLEEKMTRVNEKPFALNPVTAGLCAAPTERSRFNHSKLISGKEAAIRVYVTPEAGKAMLTRGAEFPRGAIILKEKLPTPDSEEAELFTGMLKREKGFNPDCGDWEFFTLSGDGKNVTARGKIESCMECHRDYKHSDFVAKSYVRHLKPAESAEPELTPPNNPRDR